MMEEISGTEVNWLHCSVEEELMRELWDEKSPPSLTPTEASEPEPGALESVIDKLISTVYSGPTIRDVESALSTTFLAFSSSRESKCRFSPQEKSFGKMDGKHTLRMRMCENGSTDDGYKWRKYGQKSIKNSPYPRSYYRCTNPRCNAKKQVERSLEDPEMLIVTYEGLHLHYTSYFHLPRSQDYFTAGSHVAKKPKLEPTSLQAETPDSVSVEHKVLNPSISLTQESQPEADGAGSQGLDKRTDTPDSKQHALFEDVENKSQGLLEDVVPLLVRMPRNPTTPSNDQTFSSQESSTSSSTLSWSPSSSYLDLGILSSIF